jgi:hypothetical protein
MKIKVIATTALVAIGVVLAVPGAAAAQPQFTTDFRLEHCTWSDEGRNAYFSLEPGDLLVLAGEDDGETEEVRIRVLAQTQTIAFPAGGRRHRVRARVIEERETVDGELVEVSRNFFARCRETDDIYYFGEDVDIYEDGEIVSHDGAWRAGRNGARPGLIMPATYLLGSRYFQEIAPGVALDRAEHTAMGLTVDTPAGIFRNCVEVTETTPLESGTSVKRYCPGVGLVFDSGVELVSFDVEEDDDEGDDDDGDDDDDEECDDDDGNDD